MNRTPAEPLLVARHAMATRFEIVLHGSDRPRLLAAGEEALAEIERLEAALSLYQPSSEIARVNAEAYLRPVRVTPETFRLLHHAQCISAQTRGAFDITVAPLVRCWGFMGGTGTLPSAEAISAAKSCVGFGLVCLDSNEFTVRFEKPGVMLDLGAIGKGFAIDQAVVVLREAGVTSALVHGGTSSTYAIGMQPSGDAWNVAIASPVHDRSKPFAVVQLEDESLSVSAVWGRFFQHGQKSYGHVIDPRTGMPTEGALLSAVIAPSATDGDALATALLTEPELFDETCAKRADLRCAVLSGDPSKPSVRSKGISAVMGA